MSKDQPTTIIILGGGGDLARRKLLPALFDLYVQKNLPEVFKIIGLARTIRTDDEYRLLVRSAITSQHKNLDINSLDEFCDHIVYVDGSFDAEESYTKLLSPIKTFEEAVHQISNRLFYLAVPPEHYADIFNNLHRSELAVLPENSETWSRILVEKPFGNNYESAFALDTLLSSLFVEEQIFRIDHYLAKEAVLNILSFRFANILLQSAWNKDHVAEVRITMHESINVESRGAFYDAVGALRDVGQNHLLQILALIAMEEPKEFSAQYIRDRRTELLQRLIPLTKETASSQVIRAQYEGFKATKGVRENSTTETYFEFKTFIDTEIWRDVPFYIQAGKALKTEQVRVEIVFHDVSTGPFESEDHKTLPNKIILTISPVQSMNITLNVKRPGHGYELESNTLSFAWDEDNEKGFSAYEKILIDCIEGDQTLFTKTEEVLASWKFITSITDNWGGIPLQIYEQGSAGPVNLLCQNK